MECSFVPMEYVDEHRGAIARVAQKHVSEVKKGYTSFQDCDVIFAKITPCMENGKCAIARHLTNGVGFGSTEFHVLRAGADIIPAWIYYFLRQNHIRNEATRWFRGTAGQQRVPDDFLEAVQLVLPSVPDQRRIASILERADRLRRLRRYALKLGEGYLQAVFHEKFGDLNHNPYAWQLGPLGEISDIASGVTKGQFHNGRPTVDVPYLRVANVQDGYLDLSEIKTINALRSEINALALKAGDILMTEGGDFDKLGRGAIWNNEIPICIHQNHIFRVRLERDFVLPEFFGSFLRAPYLDFIQRRPSGRVTQG